MSNLSIGNGDPFNQPAKSENPGQPNQDVTPKNINMKPGQQPTPGVDPNDFSIDVPGVTGFAKPKDGVGSNAQSNHEVMEIKIAYNEFNVDSEAYKQFIAKAKAKTINCNPEELFNSMAKAAETSPATEAPAQPSDAAPAKKAEKPVDANPTENIPDGAKTDNPTDGDIGTFPGLGDIFKNILGMKKPGENKFPVDNGPQEEPVNETPDKPKAEEPAAPDKPKTEAPAENKPTEKTPDKPKTEAPAENKPTEKTPDKPKAEAPVENKPAAKTPAKQKAEKPAEKPPVEEEPDEEEKPSRANR